MIVPPICDGLLKAVISTTKESISRRLIFFIPGYLFGGCKGIFAKSLICQAIVIVRIR